MICFPKGALSGGNPISSRAHHRRIDERLGLLLQQIVPIPAGLAVRVINRIGPEVVPAYAVVLRGGKMRGTQIQRRNRRRPIRECRIVPNAWRPCRRLSDDDRREG